MLVPETTKKDASPSSACGRSHMNQPTRAAMTSVRTKMPRIREMVTWAPPVLGDRIVRNRGRFGQARAQRRVRAEVAACDGQSGRARRLQAGQEQQCEHQNREECNELDGGGARSASNLADARDELWT